MTSVSQTDAAQRFKSGQPLQSATTRPDVSILVPAKDEAENLPLFMEQARAAFASALRRHLLLVGAYVLVGLFVAYRSTQEDAANLLGTYASTAQGPLFPAGVWQLMRGQFDYVVVGIGVLPALLASAWAIPSLVRPRDRSAHAFAVLLVTAVVAVTYEAAMFNQKFTSGAAGVWD
jgi:hypothetical protein